MTKELFINMQVIESILDLGQQIGGAFLDKQIATLQRKSKEYIESMMTFYEQRDFSSISHIAHKLGGFSGSVGACGIQKSCQNIEKSIKDNSMIEKQELVELAEISHQTIKLLKKISTDL